MAVPVWMLRMDLFSIPGVWPLKGTVEKVKEHWFNESANPNFQFPPAGLALEVAFFQLPIKPEHVGSFERENLDAHFLAWLMKLDEVKDDEVKLTAFKEASNNVVANFNFRGSQDEKTVRAYQLKEDEEKAADTVGHSVLARGRALCALQARLMGVACMGVAVSGCIPALLALWMVRCWQSCAKTSGCTPEERGPKACNRNRKAQATEEGWRDPHGD